MENYLFTSESVSRGHPDKVADQISDAVLDACLAVDPHSRVACETLVSTGLVVLAGEITTTAVPDYQQIVRDTIEEIGYKSSELGFDYRSCAVMTTINRQSPDISQGVTEGQGLHSEQGAGDQGIMFGFACNDTDELMPLPIMLSHQLMRAQVELRESGRLSWLRPDAKAQVTVEYSGDHRPQRVDTVVLSTQHDESADHDTITRDMRRMIEEVVPAQLLDDKTRYFVNPTGRFVIGGPVGDCGVTGRKIVVDTYGGFGHVGGGAFSGKDPSKVDRSATYAARYVAKNIVAAGLADRCEVQLSYAIGVAEPISIHVDSFGTIKSGTDDQLAKVIPQVFQLSPAGIIDMLQLRRPIYKQTAWGGHFGRSEEEVTWERCDKIDALRAAFSQAANL